MKPIIFITLLALCAGCAGTKNATKTPDKLNGAWVPVKEQMGETALPEAAFKNQKLIISDSAYTMVAESVDKGVVRYKGRKMDIYGKDGVNAGKHFTAIYKYDNDELTICYNLQGDGYPESFETTGKPMFFLSVFKKATWGGNTGTKLNAPSNSTLKPNRSAPFQPQFPTK